MKSEHARAAQMIRKELKQLFPGVKFSVTSHGYSGGDSVTAKWVDGPTYDAVNSVIRKYQYGHFDGMEDLYHNSNSRGDIPQSKYVFADRTISEEVYTKAFEFVRHYWDTAQHAESIDDWKMHNGSGYTVRQEIRRKLGDIDLTPGYCDDMMKYGG
jgi:hypothetical protein